MPDSVISISIACIAIGCAMWGYAAWIVTAGVGVMKYIVCLLAGPLLIILFSLVVFCILLSNAYPAIRYWWSLVRGELGCAVEALDWIKVSLGVAGAVIMGLFVVVFV